MFYMKEKDMSKSLGSGVVFKYCSSKESKVGMKEDVDTDEEGEGSGVEVDDTKAEGSVLPSNKS